LGVWGVVWCVFGFVSTICREKNVGGGYLQKLGKLGSKQRTGLGKARKKTMRGT